MVQAHPDLGRPLVAGLPYLRAEAVYAARYEMAHTLDDVLSRRTRALLLARDAAAAAAADVARLVAPELGWSDDEVARQVADFVARCDRERESAHLPATVTA
jgi:glycerol-3-phosphate dehydrogenase